jgi:hypothetical protein
METVRPGGKPKPGLSLGLPSMFDSPEWVGKVAGEGRKEETGSQPSKEDEVDPFAQREPVHHRTRILTT